MNAALSKVKCGVERWANAQIPPSEVVWPDHVPLRLWLATLIVHPGDLVRIARHLFWAWTLLPGDHVHDIPRQRDGVVSRVLRPGRVEVIWATAETHRRWPTALDGATRAVPSQPLFYPGQPTVWRGVEETTRLYPDWRWHG